MHIYQGRRGRYIASYLTATALKFALMKCKPMVPIVRKGPLTGYNGICCSPECGYVSDHSSSTYNDRCVRVDYAGITVGTVQQMMFI